MILPAHEKESSRVCGTCAFERLEEAGYRRRPLFFFFTQEEAKKRCMAERSRKVCRLIRDHMESDCDKER